MKYLKNHISLILALTSILFSIEIYSIFKQILDKYSIQIANHYTIIVVSNKKIEKLNFNNVSKIEQINIDNSLKNLTDNINIEGIDIKTLKAELPYFYKIHFKKFPTPYEIKEITKELQKLPYIKKIENFHKNQNMIYNLLSLSKTLASVFTLIISFISFLVVIKQMEIWRLEHEERIYIMDLFGASFFLKSGVLIKLAFIDSFFSTIIITMIVEFIINSNSFINLINQLNITLNINIILDIILFLSISLAISLLSIIIVIFSKKSIN
jgi:cell division transport system permease protein